MIGIRFALIMPATRLDGKSCAADLEERLKQRISNCKSQPHLAVVIVGDDPASHVYVRNKILSCERLGIKSTHIELPAETTQEEVAKTIISLNNDSTLHGILIQSPLPPHMDEESLTDLIDPRKDVDGYHGEGWNLDQRLSRLEALKMFTIWPAIASFEEDIKGTIEVGKLADFSVFDQDLMNIPELKILESNNILTVVDGRVVYQN